MKTRVNLLIAAVLSLTFGVAFASPLVVTDLNIVPFPNTPKGPSAQLAVDVVYATFNVHNDTTQDQHLKTIVDYQVVLNITNLSNITGTLGGVSFSAAKNITVLMGVAGHGSGLSSSSGSTGSSIGSFGAPAKGLWLDGNWLNVTWIPGVRPSGLQAVMSRGVWDVRSAINAMPISAPDLPENASENGYWMEGVPVKQYHLYNSTTNTMTVWDTIYANGTWINVSGRIRLAETKPNVIAIQTIVQANTNFPPRYAYQPNSIPNATSVQGTNVRINVWSGDRDFDATWAPSQSRLIMMNGTINDNPFVIQDAFSTGSINVYAATSNYVTLLPVNGTFYDTSSTSNQLKAIPLQKTIDGTYLYNTILEENHMFQTDKFGVEAFIVPRS